jgi:hypothetical protein
MEALVWKVLGVLSLPVSLLVAFGCEHDATTTWLIALLGPPVGGGLGGFVLSRLLAFPLTVLRDARRRRR